MRKQTKLVAVLSAAALLAMGASMTSFAAGWERDEAGIWHYYDRDDELVTGSWQKDGAYFFYLDDDGEMLTNSWVDDEYYVDENGRMLVNSWIKTTMDDDYSDPEDGGEYWYYFGSRGRKVVDDSRKINGRTYFFNEDGEMLTGWHEDGEEAYYLGGEDEGWRAENQWLWLEKSGLNEDEDEYNLETVLGCTEDDDCDDEGWYWFQSNGRAYHGTARKRINGRYYLFNAHGQMLYEWINGAAHTVSSNAQLDGIATAGEASVSDMRYYNAVEEGWRADGWYEIEGSEDVGSENDTDWYYVDNGEIEYADGGEKDRATYDADGDPIYIQRIRINSRYFAFNEKGQMQTGLQYAKADNGFFYFDENGYQRTGRVTAVENDDDDYTYYFNTSNGRNGQGYNGLNNDYLYFNGKRLDADDDFRLYFYDGEIYLVNNRGKVQKTSKKYDIENRTINEDDVEVAISGKKVQSIKGANFEYTREELLAELYAIVNGTEDKTIVTDDLIVSVPFIQLYDDDLYSYTFSMSGERFIAGEGWFGLNQGNNN